MSAPVQNTPPEAVSLWIDGKPHVAAAGRFADVRNPAQGLVVRRTPLCGAEEVELAVAAAARAYPGWRATRPLERARIMARFREELEASLHPLVRLIVEEHGKSMDEAMGEVERGIEVVEFATGIAHLLKGEALENAGGGVDSISLRQPLGVCAGITPFNFPAMVPLWMIPVALACGNTFVLKPSEKVPSASLLMAELLGRAGLPPGVFNVVHGDEEAVAALITHAQVRAVSFVGSTPVARQVYAACGAAGKRVQALGGAKNHAVVMPDADLDLATHGLIQAAYGSAGQRCMAVSVVVAVGTVADALVARLKQAAAALRVGAGRWASIDMGPLISGAQHKRVTGLIDSGVGDGAELVLDGRGLKVLGAELGYFVGPTLFDRVTPSMRIYQEEIFGPVLAVMRVDTLDEAIALVNASAWGNGAVLFTREGAAARRFQDEVEAGMVGINVPVPVPMAFFSFGGWKDSLLGDLHLHGPDGVRFYTRGKVVASHWPAG